MVINGHDGHVLFDPMTHTKEGYVACPLISYNSGHVLMQIHMSETAVLEITVRLESKPFSHSIAVTPFAWSWV